jgi:hypothetical protein
MILILVAIAIIILIVIIGKNFYFVSQLFIYNLFIFFVTFIDWFCFVFIRLLPNFYLKALNPFIKAVNSLQFN